MPFVLALIALILGVLILVKVVADSALIIGAAIILLSLAVMFGSYGAVTRLVHRP